MQTINIIEVIKEHSLTVRCLPHKKISYWTYHEGDENRKWVDSKGNPSKSKKSLVIREDGKKLLKEERDIEHGGWWYVKQTKNTDSTVTFSRKYDKFFAPTIEEAVKLYLDSLNNNLV